MSFDLIHVFFLPSRAKLRRMFEERNNINVARYFYKAVFLLFFLKRNKFRFIWNLQFYIKISKGSEMLHCYYVLPKI